MSKNRYIVIAEPCYTDIDGHIGQIAYLYCDMYYIPENEFDEQDLSFLNQTEGMDVTKLKLLNNNVLSEELKFEQYRNKLQAKPFTIVSCHYTIY